MTSKEIWNYLVDHYNRNIWANEDVIQRDWESFFADAELFKYSKIKGEVDSHRTLQIGSYERVIPDIILKKGGDDLFVVELKKYSLHFSKEREAQLFSYIKLLHISIGVLVCDKIYIYAYDFEASEQENKLEIPFEKDNTDGVAFVDLFCKDEFSKDKIFEYIFAKKSFSTNVKKIKSQISQNLIYDVLKEHFAVDYKTEEVEAALRDYSFSFECADQPTIVSNVQSMQQPKSPQNTTTLQNMYGYTETESINLRFWTKFNQYAFNNAEFRSEFSMRKPANKHWYDFSIGSSKCHIGVTHLKDRLGIEIYIPDYKPLYDHFFSHKNEIEAIVGRSLEWKKLPEKKASRILITTSQFDMSDESLYEKEFDWIIKYTLKFKKAFAPFCI